MSLYNITAGSMPQASDVQQLIDFLKGNHDLGNVNLPLAVNPPSTSGFSLSLSSGTALGVGTYSYAFTLITGYFKSDGVTFNVTGETLASSNLTITTTSGNQAVKITLPTTGFPAYVSAIGIYRTKVGSSTPGLVNTLKIGNTSYIDTTPDGNLGTFTPSTNSTGTKLFIDSWTAPNQPIFSCTTPNTFTSLAANVETTIPYTGSNFDSTGLYTCPATGRYLFCPQFYCNINNGIVTMYYYKNGTNTYALGRYQNPTTTTCDFIFGPSIVVALNQGDTVKFTATATAANTVGYQNCVISVIKVA